MGVYVSQGLLGYIARGKRKEPAGADLASIVNEDGTRAFTVGLRRRRKDIGLSQAAARFAYPLLQ